MSHIRPIGQTDEVPVLGRRFAWRPGLAPLAGEPAVAAKAAVERKIADGLYRFEAVTCFCGREDDVLLATRDYYGFQYPIVACRRCGLLRANPRMTESSYEQFYDEEYRPAYGEVDSELDRYFALDVSEGRAAREYVLANLTGDGRPGVVFDIGCDMGGMLVAWSEAGCDVSGVDLNSSRVAEGRRRSGFDLRVGRVDELLATGRKADLVLVNHVLEHVLDLEPELEKVAALVGPGGHVYVAVPGTFGWIEAQCGGDILALLQNAHTYQFSLATLTYVMECCGFERVAGNEEIRSLFGVAPSRRARGDVPPGEYERVMTYLQRLERRYAVKRVVKECARAVRRRTGIDVLRLLRLRR